MKTKSVSIELFKQLLFVCDQIGEKAFTDKLEILSGSTIGQHIRHIVEFYDCLMRSSETGSLCYDKRAHDKSLESDMGKMVAKIHELNGWLGSLESDKTLELEIAYPLSGVDKEKMGTSVLREIVYNIEHMIHHMAIIKIGLNQSFPDLKLPAHFGVAQSTVVYQMQN
ncbi:hypothetical protein FUAX_22360 [Fulvitalea axinellae]|uniref:DinB family protein n=1 Tax=Fulvitalea axinellae TaxID=1182444 RepID=A0AAU9CTN9_9BACT|nr:hypothetical protein FUAX_22360 [Fulvitalea axinellae]